MSRQPKPVRLDRRRLPGNRPLWHRLVGWTTLILGVIVIVLNDLMRLADVRLLPGGHSEFYLLAGLLIAGQSLWWFGWWDRSARR